MSHKRLKGFTLVELLVTLAIATMLMTVNLFSYARFNDLLALTEAGQEIALAIRQSQTFGLNVKEVTRGGGVFTSGYGVYFDLNDLTHFYFYVDSNANGVYNAGSGCGSGSTECIQMYTFKNGISISQICDGNNNCPPNPGFSVRNMSVSFLRPNPDAIINFANNGATIMAIGNTGKIVLISPKGRTSTVTVENTGQIYVQ